MNRTLVLLTMLPIVMTACPPPIPPAPTLSVITVNKTITGALKIGQATTLTATGTRSDGSQIGLTPTWTSSNPSIASVDANGVVTAKRIGLVTISANSENVTGTTSIGTYGLEAVGGTYTPNTGTLGTALTFKVRGPNGNPPAVGTPFIVSGPSGWRPGRPPVQLKFYDSGAWGINWWGLYQSTPITGTYQASIIVGGETLTASFLIDASKTVAVTSSFTLSGVTTTGATVTWTKPAGAFNFAVAIEDFTAGVSLAEQQPKADTATFSGLSLNAAHTNLMEVFLSSADVSQNDPVFPAQLDLSIYFQQLAF